MPSIHRIKSKTAIVQSIRLLNPGHSTSTLRRAAFDEAEPDTLLDRADRALYQAKREGSNRVAVWGPSFKAS